jgi:hypothetical protein
MSIRRDGYDGFSRSLWRRLRDSDTAIKVVCVVVLIDALAVAAWLAKSL